MPCSPPRSSTSASTPWAKPRASSRRAASPCAIRVDSGISAGERSAMIEPAFDEHGLVPCVVQDVDRGRVLMLAWMNAEALAKTEATKLVTFWSRSRKALWTKGETSGNTLALVEVRLDC